MLVTNRLKDAPAGGRELLCKLNHDALKDLYGDRLTVMQLDKSPVRNIKAAINAFRGHLDGVSPETIDAALRKIEDGNIERIFVDGSNLGELVMAVKTQFPAVTAHTFFHNVEARFFWGSFRQSLSFRALAIAAANYLAEKKAVRWSDRIICLSQRDSLMLRTLYGRTATDISPMALRDKAASGPPRTGLPPDELYALFVGGLFYANRAGIQWFADEVVPRIGIKVCIVGKGFEAFRSDLERPGKIQVLGAVETLSDWYENARFVVAPIFDGSGMKTKVAEALMFGKKVVGTPEAFSGYEDIADRAGWTCTTADEFVTAIEKAQALPLRPFDPELRALYEEKYSYPAARMRLARIMGADGSCA